MKCAVIGGSVLPKDLGLQANELLHLSTWLVHNDVTVLTGACGGFPYLVGRECVRMGGTVIGYSPASCEAEHRNIYHHPVDGCTSIQYMDSEMGENAKFLCRSLPLIERADVVICMEGNWGTLYELVTGVICGKTLIVLCCYGGISDQFSRIYLELSTQCKYDYGEHVIIADTVDELIQNLEACIY